MLAVKPPEIGVDEPNVGVRAELNAEPVTTSELPTQLLHDTEIVTCDDCPAASPLTVTRPIAWLSHETLPFVALNEYVKSAS